jgi:hypothetical protein
MLPNRGFVMERLVGILGGLVGGAIAGVLLNLILGLPVGAGAIFGLSAGIFGALGALLFSPEKTEISLRKSAFIGALTLVTLGTAASVVGYVTGVLFITQAEFFGMLAITTVVGGAAGLCFGLVRDFYRYLMEDPFPVF